MGRSGYAGMLPMSLTRNRKADRQEKVHNAAIKRAFERKAVREFIKANPDVVLVEEEETKAADQDQRKDEDCQPQEFFDICNEKRKTKKSVEADKKSTK